MRQLFTIAIAAGALATAAFASTVTSSGLVFTQADAAKAAAPLSAPATAGRG